MTEDVEQGPPDSLQADGEGEPVNLKGKKDDKLLFRCSKSGKQEDIDLLEKLLDSRKKGEKEGEKFVDFINKKDKRGNSSIHYAMKEGHLKVLQKMMDKAGRDLDFQQENFNKMKPLHFAARYGENGESVLECIKWTCKTKGYTVKEEDKYGYNLFHHAIQNIYAKDTKLVEELVKMHDFKVGGKDGKGNTSLHIAAQNKKSEVIKFLLDRATANPKKKTEMKDYLLQTNIKKQTPIHIACQMGDFESVRMILEFLKDSIVEILGAEDDNSNRPLDLAIESGKDALVKLLVNKGAQIYNEQDKIFSIHTCARVGTKPLMKAILDGELGKKGEECWSPDKKDKDGKTAFFRAAEENRSDILELFMTGTVDVDPSKLSAVNQQETEKDSSNMASQRNLIPDVKEDKDKEGLSPLMVSLQEGHERCVKALLRKDPKDPQSVRDNAKDFLTGKDFAQNNIFHFALQSKEPTLMTGILLETMEQVNDESLTIDLLFKENTDQDTPLHLLADSNHPMDRDKVLMKLFRILTDKKILIECLNKENEGKETPLHVAARKGFIDFLSAIHEIAKSDMSDPTEGNSKTMSEEIMELLKRTDEDGNTALHLSTQKESSEQIKTETVSLILKILGPESEKDQILKKNKFDKTAISEAAKGGDLESLKIMMDCLEKGSGKARKMKQIDDEDLEGNTPLIKAASEGHVDTFKFLLRKRADLTKRTSTQQTALNIAIENNQRDIIDTILEGKKWEEAFREPCPQLTPVSSSKFVNAFKASSDLDTPLRKLIRDIPDLAEKVLDKCYVVHGKNVEMNFELLEDKFNYRKDETGKYYNVHSDPNKNVEILRDGQGDIISYDSKFSDYTKENHPLMIMGTEKKLNLLQHPLCLALVRRKWSGGFKWVFRAELFSYLAFLFFLTSYILTSPGPLSRMDLFNCTSDFFMDPGNRTHSPNITDDLLKNSAFNEASYIGLYFMCIIRIYMLGLQTRELLVLRHKFRYNRIETYPLGILIEVSTIGIAVYVALDQYSTSPWYDEKVKIRSCLQWNFSAYVLTAGWINLLFHMRQLFGIGRYIILFNDIIVIFLTIFPLIFIMIIGFGLGFHILLSNQDAFSRPEYALIKTIIMFSGEFDYENIFFSGEGVGHGDGPAPFPSLTYTMFLFFFFLLSLVSINVLIGLTLEEIQKFLKKADLRSIDTKIQYILFMEEVKERHRIISDYFRKPKRLENKLSFETTIDRFDQDLLSESKISEIIEQKQNETKNKAEQGKDLKKYINTQMMTAKQTQNRQGTNQRKLTEPIQDIPRESNDDEVERLNSEDSYFFDGDSSDDYFSDDYSSDEDNENENFEDTISRIVKEEVSKLSKAQEDGQKKMDELSKLLKEEFRHQKEERTMEKAERKREKKEDYVYVYGNHLV